MKNWLKKIQAIVLAIIMTLALIPNTAFADNSITLSSDEIKVLERLSSESDLPDTAVRALQNAIAAGAIAERDFEYLSRIISDFLLYELKLDYEYTAFDYETIDLLSMRINDVLYPEDKVKEFLLNCVGQWQLIGIATAGSDTAMENIPDGSVEIFQDGSMTFDLEGTIQKGTLQESDDELAVELDGKAYEFYRGECDFEGGLLYLEPGNKQTSYGAAYLFVRPEIQEKFFSDVQVPEDMIGEWVLSANENAEISGLPDNMSVVIRENGVVDINMRTPDSNDIPVQFQYLLNGYISEDNVLINPEFGEISLTNGRIRYLQCMGGTFERAGAISDTTPLTEDDFIGTWYDFIAGLIVEIRNDHTCCINEYWGTTYGKWQLLEEGQLRLTPDDGDTHDLEMTDDGYLHAEEFLLDSIDPDAPIDPDLAADWVGTWINMDHYSNYLVIHEDGTVSTDSNPVGGRWYIDHNGKMCIKSTQIISRECYLRDGKLCVDIPTGDDYETKTWERSGSVSGSPIGEWYATGIASCVKFWEDGTCWLYERSGVGRTRITPNSTYLLGDAIPEQDRTNASDWKNEEEILAYNGVEIVIYNEDGRRMRRGWYFKNYEEKGERLLLDMWGYSRGLGPECK